MNAYIVLLSREKFPKMVSQAESTLLMNGARHARVISVYSRFPLEFEAILPSGTCVFVVDDAAQNRFSIRSVWKNSVRSMTGMR